MIDYQAEWQEKFDKLEKINLYLLHKITDAGLCPPNTELYNLKDHPFCSMSQYNCKECWLIHINEEIGLLRKYDIFSDVAFMPYKKTGE